MAKIITDKLITDKLEAKGYLEYHDMDETLSLIHISEPTRPY